MLQVHLSGPRYLPKLTCSRSPRAFILGGLHSVMSVLTIPQGGAPSQTCAGFDLLQLQPAGIFFTVCHVTLLAYIKLKYNIRNIIWLFLNKYLASFVYSEDFVMNSFDKNVAS